ncbi:hypothetical protein Aduo_019175 [Ancylostoma duodenale]
MHVEEEIDGPAEAPDAGDGFAAYVLSRCAGTIPSLYTSMRLARYCGLDDVEDDGYDDDDEDYVVEDAGIRKSQSEKELITRTIKIEDVLAVAMENEKTLKEEVDSLSEIVYSYANAKTIAELRQLKGLNISHFVLALEVKTHKDDTVELELLVDNCVRTKDRVLFMQQVIFANIQPFQ